MRIAVVGWGGLLFERWRFPESVEWKSGGPAIPIGISSSARAYLAFDPLHGRRGPTQYAISPRTRLKEALEDIASREDPTLGSVGYVAGEQESASERLGGFAPQLLRELRQWCDEQGFDALIWRWENPPAVTFH